MSAGDTGGTALERQIRSQPEELARLLSASQTQEQVHAGGPGPAPGPPHLAGRHRHEPARRRARRLDVAGGGPRRPGRAVDALRRLGPARGARRTASSSSPTPRRRPTPSPRAPPPSTPASTSSRSRGGVPASPTPSRPSRRSRPRPTPSATPPACWCWRCSRSSWARSPSRRTPFATCPTPWRARSTAPASESVPADARVLVITGSGPASVTAREGALKVERGRARPRRRVTTPNTCCTAPRCHCAAATISSR